jgi:hypothetical protein
MIQPATKKSHHKGSFGIFARNEREKLAANMRLFSKMLGIDETMEINQLLPYMTTSTIKDEIIAVVNDLINTH